MDGNFLSSLLRSPGPGIDPEGLPPQLAAILTPQAPAANVMQAAAAPPAPQPAPVAAAPRERHSLLDKLGRAADVFARVGGAEALYQPTLDAREDREIMRGDHARQVDMEGLRHTLAEQQIGAGTDEAAGRQNTRLGAAVRGLQAIQRSGGSIDQAWPILAKQAGIPEDRAAQLGQIFAANPQALGGFASMLGATDPAEFGVQPFYAQDADGKLRAYQLGRDGTVRPIELGEGEVPADPLTFVNAGDRQVGVGRLSGDQRVTVRTNERPGMAADRETRLRIAREGNASRERTAATRGTKPAAGAPTAAMVETARGSLNELRQIYGNLNKMGAMVSPNRSTGGNIVSRVRSSAAGQVLEGAVGTQAQTLRDRVASIRPGLMQSIARATGMTGRQLDSNADVKLFMQTVTNPSASYEANLQAIAGLERFLAANAKSIAATPGAPRPAAPRRAAPRARPQPRPPAGTGGGWGRATVVR